MRDVKVGRTELLAKVKANRDAHRDLFLKAQVGYRQAVIKELDSMLQDARDGRNIRRHISLPEPQDHTDDYDRVIYMLEMSVDETITIDATSFDQYVMDNWHWKAQATGINSSYTN